MAFTKLDSGIIYSSVWSEPYPTRLVWITMLAMADSEGFVRCSLPGLQRAANVSLDECKAALVALEKADPYSRTPDNSGARIRASDGGWLILNYVKYRARTDRDYLREKQAVYRYKKSCIDTVSIPSASASVSVRSNNLDLQDQDLSSKIDPALRYGGDTGGADAGDTQPKIDACAAAYCPELARVKAAYPKILAPYKADAAWAELVSSGHNPHALAELILQALEWQTKSLDWVKEGGKFVPDLCRYLEEGRFLAKKPGEV